eukprot:TRINITY_DN3518_c0_g1_i4.p1 TRINITY_DN3518_c0_g1~~TRINITY_DN3518_c0_g1_i4.p1  ORF type:complete len:762 (-),score=86.79 TRINITY_DN3518_c0_g1_i4:6-2291(-)
MFRLLTCCYLLLLISSSDASQLSSIITRRFSQLQTDARLTGFLEKRTSRSEGSLRELASPHCVHDQISHDLFHPYKQRLQNKRLQHARRFNSSEFEPMRFFVNEDLMTGQSDPRACYSSEQTVQTNDYGATTSYQCTQQDLLSSDLQTLLIDHVIPTVLEIVQSFLNVRPSEGNHRLNEQSYYGFFAGKCYYDVPIPPTYVSVGVPNADYIIFVTARPAEDGVVAYALGCNFDEQDQIGRPLAGLINFNPRFFRELEENFSEMEFRMAIKTGVHELTHALGFSSNLFPYFVDQSGNPHDVVTSETRSGYAASGQPYFATVNMISSPNVLAAAREQFNCSDVTSVELENYGGSGTAGSHWEMRVMGNELMTGYVNYVMPVSTITMALFNDMGWYYANYSAAENFGWGKDQGCDFLNHRCELTWPGRSGYWCTSLPNAPLSCTPDGTAKGQCGLSSYSNLDPYYQHFSNPAVGGPIPPADYCPFVYSYVSNRHCEDPSMISVAAQPEYFGADSKCFGYRTVGTPSGKCLQYRCVEGDLEVGLSGYWYSCPSEGGEISTNSSGVSIICPKASIFCRANAMKLVNTTSVSLTTTKITSGSITSSPLVSPTSTGGWSSTSGSETDVADSDTDTVENSSENSHEGNSRRAVIAVSVVGALLVGSAFLVLFLFVKYKRARSSPLEDGDFELPPNLSISVFNESETEFDSRSSISADPDKATPVNSAKNSTIYSEFDGKSAADFAENKDAAADAEEAERLRLEALLAEE